MNGRGMVSKVFIPLPFIPLPIHPIRHVCFRFDHLLCCPAVRQSRRASRGFSSSPHDEGVGRGSRRGDTLPRQKLLLSPALSSTPRRRGSRFGCGVSRVAFIRTQLLESIESQLVHQTNVPTRNLKPLRGLVPPWEHLDPTWEIRVGEYRVFYDVDEAAAVVHIRAAQTATPNNWRHFMKNPFWRNTRRFGPLF